MPIPNLNSEGLLPEGVHQTSMIEVKVKFGNSNKHRVFLMGKLILVLANLCAAGVVNVWIDGSFVTDKEIPGDIDICWEYYPGVNRNILDSVFFRSQKEIKNKYSLHVFPTGAWAGEDWVSFFQRVRNPVTMKTKGILFVKLNLEDLQSLK